MKKIMLSMFCIFLLVGCSTKQENITIKKNNNQETVDLKVGFGLHHIEDGYSFDGNDVDINYDYEVVGRDANFGLMIFLLLPGYRCWRLQVVAIQELKTNTGT